MKINQKTILGLASVIIFVLLFVGFILFDRSKVDEPIWESTSSTSEMSHSEVERISSDAQVTEIVVDIKGAIQQPGVYHLPIDARLNELILAAGGFTKEAEERQLNLAEKLSDQQMIYVPSKEEVDFKVEPPVTVVGNDEGSSVTSLINLNTANLSELQELPGVGPAKAQAILTYREENGLFSSVEDLLNISGFGEKTIEKLRKMVEI